MSSEEKAESLYGPAPEGDEDPHASQAVPDPGDSPSYAELKYENPKFPASVLNSYHLGHNVRVMEQRNGYKFGAHGRITGIQHGASIIRDGSLADPDAVTLGRRWVQLTFDANSGTRVTPDATVELLD